MIIPSLLDTDHYKITMGQVVFNQFPRARARYAFTDRDRRPFAAGFGAELRRHIDAMADLQATADEIAWLRSTVRYLKPTYLDWLAHYRFDPAEVMVRQDGGALQIEIEGPWYRTIFWEVPLLALVSELYFAGVRPEPGWEERTAAKADRLAAAGVHWADFGTRRRFSHAVQDRVNEIMRAYRPLFLGTSNPYFARKYGLTPVGTYAHEAPMAMQALAGVVACDRRWMEAWVREYEGDLGIALMDTLTTPCFLRSFGRSEAKLFDGVRQDSGDPSAIAELVIRHYEGLHIDPRTKRIIFSDQLNDAKLIALHRELADRIMVAGGIGTFLTNDVGHRPLNIVIKLTAADFGFGFVPVIKLSDVHGKHSGDPARVAAALTELGIG